MAPACGETALLHRSHEQGQIVGRGDAMRVIPFDDVTVAREEAA